MCMYIYVYTYKYLYADFCMRNQGLLSLFKHGSPYFGSLSSYRDFLERPESMPTNDVDKVFSGASMHAYM